MNIGFIGAAGNIAGAIIYGILKSGAAEAKNFYLFDVNQSKNEQFKSLGMQVVSSAKEAAEHADYLFLAVKPQIIFDVLHDIKPYIRKEQCLVSVAAGVSISSIKSAIGFDCKVVRVMPNTPLLLSEGASGLCFAEPVTKEEFETVCGFFKSSGVAVVCDEAQINAVTAVSGSGPAYVFKFAKAVIDEAKSMGLSEEKAAALFYQTLIGSAVMLRDSGKTPDELIKMVTSPKGTTLAALESFDENNFEQMIQKAVLACKDRADELASIK